MSRYTMRATLLLLVLALLGGCATSGGGGAPGAGATRPSQQAGSGSVSDRTVADSNAGESAATQVSGDTAPNGAAATQAAGGVQSILRERRRSDFPNVETSAFGFTITEPARIPGDVQARYQDALAALQRSDYATGIRLLEDIIAAAPGLTAPYVELGIAYGLVDELESAATALETAAALSPDHPIVRNELGIVYRRLGRFDEARAQYEAALAVFADFHFARRNLAVLCDLYLADPQCALSHYEAYLDSSAEDPEVEIWAADLRLRINAGGRGE